MSILSRMMEKQRLEPEVIRRIKELSMMLGFTETLFVGKAGDNSDGSSWAHAYTSLKTALDWIESNQNTGEVHAVILGNGSWDMSLTGTPTYSKNIVIIGVSKHKSIISNTHATATGILQFTGYCSIHNLSIDCLTGETGININGAGSYGSILSGLEIDCSAFAAGNDGILLDGGTYQIHIDDIHIDGEATNTSALRLNDAYDCVITNVIIHTALVGLQLDHADDDNNEFDHCHLHDCATGIQIAAGGATNNHFDDIMFHGCTARISDAGTNTSFSHIHLDLPLATIFPADLTGIELTAGVGANTWSAAAVEIRSAAAATKPFIITGIKIEPNAAEKWGIRLYSDGGTTPFYETLTDLRGGGANILQPEILDEPYFINQGLQISGTAKSETGGNDIDIWLAIEIV